MRLEEIRLVDVRMLRAGEALRADDLFPGGIFTRLRWQRLGAKHAGGIVGSPSAHLYPKGYYWRIVPRKRGRRSKP